MALHLVTDDTTLANNPVGSFHGSGFNILNTERGILICPFGKSKFEHDITVKEGTVLRFLDLSECSNGVVHNTFEPIITGRLE